MSSLGDEAASTAVSNLLNSSMYLCGIAASGGGCCGRFALDEIVVAFAFRDDVERIERKDLDFNPIGGKVALLSILPDGLTHRDKGGGEDDRATGGAVEFMEAREVLGRRANEGFEEVELPDRVRPVAVRLS